MAQEQAEHWKQDTAPGENRRDARGKFVRPSIWLSLSGGGFRAAIFHYGCMKRLRELGLLGHIYAFSGSSGGAIVASLVHAHCKGAASDAHLNERLEEYDWDEFEHRFLSLVGRGIIGPVMQLLAAYGLYLLGVVLFAVSWLLLRPHPALAGWTGLPEFSWVVARDLSIGLFAAGLAVHANLARMLIAEGAHRPVETAARMAGIDDDFAKAEWAHASLSRLVKMLLLPSCLRRQIVNLRACRGALLKGIRTQPKLFLTTVDLNSGKETIFTSGLFADLSETGCRYLWDQRADGDANSTGSAELAEAVTASSAFTPFFHPVTIRNRNRVIGVFIDGGTLDYYALNVPRAFGVRVHDEGGEPEGEGLPPLRKEISFVLGLDGCRAATVKFKRHWSRAATLRRFKEVVVDQTLDVVELFAEEFDRRMGMRTAIAGLPFGFPEGNALHDAQVNTYLTRIRTHLDSFSLEETATLAYCGYLQAERAIAEALPLADYEGARYVPPAPFEAILPAYCGSWRTSLPELRRHLQYSNRLFLIARMCGRKLGV